MQASLRRRKANDGKRSRSRSQSRSPAAEDGKLNEMLPPDPDESKELALVPVSSVSKLQAQQKAKRKGVKRLTGFIFFLGGLFGLLLAGFFAQRNELIDFADLGDLNLNTLMDALPAGVLQDARELRVCLRYTAYCWVTNGLARKAKRKP